MILILSHSRDFTTDDVIEKLHDVPVFRFNIDLWYDYRWSIGPQSFRIEDPSGRVCREQDVHAVYLRKLLFHPPFVDIPAGGCEEIWRREELMQVWLGLRDWAQETGRLSLVKPSPNGHWSKIRQMKLAQDFFRVPEWRVIHGTDPVLEQPTVVKTLAAGNVGQGAIVVVREVNPASLSPAYPWFLQQKVKGATHDVTVAWVAGQMFAYELRRDSFAGVDVRIPTFEQNLSWEPVALTEAEQDRIRGFMTRTGLDFGRLDFLRVDGELLFLEVNPNGQYAWLDPDGTNGLLYAVAGAIRDVWERNRDGRAS